MNNESMSNYPNKTGYRMNSYASRATNWNKPYNADSSSNSDQRSFSQNYESNSPVNRNYNSRPYASGLNQSDQGNANLNNRTNMTRNTFPYNTYSPGKPPNTALPLHSLEELPGRQPLRTPRLSQQNLSTSLSPPSSRPTLNQPMLPNMNMPPPRKPPPRRKSPDDTTMRFSPPPDAADRSLRTRPVPTQLIDTPHLSPAERTMSSHPNQDSSYNVSMQAYGVQSSFYNRVTTMQPPLPNKPPSPPPPPPKEAPPTEYNAMQRQGNLRYQNGLPYVTGNVSMISAYRSPPPTSLTHMPPNFYSVPPPRIVSPRAGMYPTMPPYQSQGGYMGSPSVHMNNYKRKLHDGDENRKNNKKRKKPLSQNIPQRKDWSMADAQRAMNVEKECNNRAKSQSLIIKFPDLELNRDIVSKFHSAIENVHFQQPSTARFCFVTLKGCADPEIVIQELNRTRFGQGFLLAEVKKDREEDLNIGPEDIDPTTLYVGNLAQEVTKEDMMNTFPHTKRIDIGYAKKMKYTRYAFVSFRSVDHAIEAFKRTHSTQMHNKSLIVRFRRLHGTVGMPGEPKPQVARVDSTNRPATISESESEPQELQVDPSTTVDVDDWHTDADVHLDSFNRVKMEPIDADEEEFYYSESWHSDNVKQEFVRDSVHSDRCGLGEMKRESTPYFGDQDIEFKSQVPRPQQQNHTKDIKPDVLEDNQPVNIQNRETGDRNQTKKADNRKESDQRENKIKEENDGIQSNTSTLTNSDVSWPRPIEDVKPTIDAGISNEPSSERSETNNVSGSDKEIDKKETIETTEVKKEHPDPKDVVRKTVDTILSRSECSGMTGGKDVAENCFDFLENTNSDESKEAPVLKTEDTDGTELPGINEELVFELEELVAKSKSPERNDVMPEKHDRDVSSSFDAGRNSPTLANTSLDLDEEKPGIKTEEEPEELELPGMNEELVFDLPEPEAAVTKSPEIKENDAMSEMFDWDNGNDLNCESKSSTGDKTSVDKNEEEAAVKTEDIEDAEIPGLNSEDVF